MSTNKVIDNPIDDMPVDKENINNSLGGDQNESVNTSVTEAGESVVDKQSGDDLSVSRDDETVTADNTASSTDIQDEETKETEQPQTDEQSALDTNDPSSPTISHSNDSNNTEEQENDLVPRETSAPEGESPVSVKEQSESTAESKEGSSNAGSSPCPNLTSDSSTSKEESESTSSPTPASPTPASPTTASPSPSSPAASSTPLISIPGDTSTTQSPLATSPIISIPGESSTTQSPPASSPIISIPDSSQGAISKTTSPTTTAQSETPELGATTSTSSPSTTPSEEKEKAQSVYHVKWIKFKNSSHAIITQNENGPCPLLAVMNVLLLEGRVKLPSMIQMVTSQQLMEYLADCIFEHAPKNISEDDQVNYEQNRHDAMAVFPKLQTGLDVNVKFTGVQDFEYTPECIVFDLLGIQLYHGWLVDPQVPKQCQAINSCSYNQLVEKIITQKNSSNEEEVTNALIAEEFLECTASQLTWYGLSEIGSQLKDNQLCVFFRNNHFSTLYKRKDELFVLVTDQGFLTEANVVWETLCNVEGDGNFVDAAFHTFQKSEPSVSPIQQSLPDVPLNTDQQIDRDYMLALTLNEENARGSAAAAGSASQDFSPPAPVSPLTDHQLALQLQEEENQRAASAVAAQQALPRSPNSAPSHSPSSSHPPPGGATGGATGTSRERKKSNSDCVIL